MKPGAVQIAFPRSSVQSSGMALSVNRREFLLGLGATAVLAACGSSASRQSASTTTAPRGWSALTPSTDLYQSDRPQRFAFIVTNNGRFRGGPAAQIGFGEPGASRTGQIVAAPYHGDGLEAGRGVYVVDATFPVAGRWGAGIRLDNGQQFAMPFEVKATPTAPTVGSAAPRAASPVPGTPLGVDPICTRDPVCSLHTQSTAAVIGSGTPAVVMFATPARCQTAYCGPVLDLLLEVTPEYQGRVNFVHSEIYRDTQSEKLSPTVEVWGLVTEPWLFTIDGSGKIVKRLDGAFDRTEIRDAVAQLVS